MDLSSVMFTQSFILNESFTTHAVNDKRPEVVQQTQSKLFACLLHCTLTQILNNFPIRLFERIKI